jgi:hypothetical protein
VCDHPTVHRGSPSPTLYGGRGVQAYGLLDRVHGLPLRVYKYIYTYMHVSPMHLVAAVHARLLL